MFPLCEVSHLKLTIDLLVQIGIGSDVRIRFFFAWDLLAQDLRSDLFLLISLLTSPTSISNIRTPSPHQSTALVYEVSVNTSGAKNSGVPQNVPVRSPNPMPSLHRPKSAILT